MKILDSKNNSIFETTSLLRGEQVFTSMLFWEGKFLFIDEHLERLIKGASFFFPKDNWENKLPIIKDYLELQKRTLLGNFYCRLTISDDNFFVIFKDHEISQLQVSLERAFQTKTPSLRPSYLKLSQYADSVLELRQTHADDIVFFDQENFVTEASTSNIFVITKSEQIMTPKLSSTVLDGIIRSKICKKLNIAEQNIREDELINAREIWLSNSIKGLRFVSSYQMNVKEFESSLFQSVVNQFGRYGEKINE